VNNCGASFLLKYLIIINNLINEFYGCESRIIYYLIWYKKLSFFYSSFLTLRKRILFSIKVIRDTKGSSPNFFFTIIASVSINSNNRFEYRCSFWNVALFFFLNFLIDFFFSIWAWSLANHFCFTSTCSHFTSIAEADRDKWNFHGNFLLNVMLFL